MLQMLNRNANPQMQPANNPMQMMQQFQQFAKGMTPQGAKAKIDQMLQSGEITQDQINQAIGMAKNFQGMFR